MNIRTDLSRLAFTAAIVSTLGCHPRAGISVADFDRLNLEASPVASWNLTLGDHKIRVRSVNHLENGQLEIRLNQEKSTLDTERYELGKQNFGVVEAAGERYDPALTVLAVPLELDVPRKWEGTITTGDVIRSATAVTRMSRDQLFLPSAVTTLRAQVSIQIGDDASLTHREMSFWFEEGRGLVQRQFGSSVRSLASE